MDRSSLIWNYTNFKSGTLLNHLDNSALWAGLSTSHVFFFYTLIEINALPWQQPQDQWRPWYEATDTHTEEGDLGVNAGHCAPRTHPWGWTTPTPRTQSADTSSSTAPSWSWSTHCSGPRVLVGRQRPTTSWGHRLHTWIIIIIIMSCKKYFHFGCLKCKVVVVQILTYIYSPISNLID